MWSVIKAFSGKAVSWLIGGSGASYGLIAGGAAFLAAAGGFFILNFFVIEPQNERLAQANQAIGAWQLSDTELRNDIADRNKIIQGWRDSYKKLQQDHERQQVLILSNEQIKRSLEREADSLKISIRNLKHENESVQQYLDTVIPDALLECLYRESTTSACTISPATKPAGN